MLENLLVALIVALSALYAGMKYLPASWRQHIVFALARGGRRQAALARLLDTESSCGGGCKSCNSCADTAAPTPSALRVIKLKVQP